MVDTLTFVTNYPLRLTPEMFYKENNRATRHRFKNFHIEVNKHYPVTRVNGSLSSFVNNGANYPLIKPSDVNEAIKSLCSDLEINANDCRIERIDTAIDIQTKVIINPYDITSIKNKFMWGQSEENSINTKISSIQRLVIYQNGKHNDREIGLRLESRYLSRPFARTLNDLNTKALSHSANNILTLINDYEFKAPEIDVIGQFNPKVKPTKKEIDKILGNAYLHLLSEVEFQNLLNILKSLETDRRLIKAYQAQRFEAIKNFKKGVIIDPIQLFKDELNKILL
jgi:hypothetical protein